MLSSFMVLVMLKRKLFSAPYKVNGVGPKMALGILSTLSVELLVHTIEHDDVNTLVKVPCRQKQLNV